MRRLSWRVTAPAFGVLCVAILGIADGPKIAIIWIGTFFQMVLVVANTTRQFDDSLLEAAQTLGVELLSVEARRPDELESALATMLVTRPDVLMVTGDPVLAAAQRAGHGAGTSAYHKDTPGSARATTT